MVEILSSFGLKTSEKKVLRRKINRKTPKKDSFINEVASFQPATLLKENSSTGAKFLRMFFL